MPDQPVVGHILRAFLAPTETFIGNQIITLQRYRPVVFCHHRRANASYSLTDVFSVQELLPRAYQLVDRISYRAARYLPLISARVLAEQIKRESVNVLHFHFLVDARFFLALKRLTKLPAVVSGYGYDVSSFPRSGWGYGKRYLQPIFREMDCFIAMSHDMKQDLIRIGCPEHKIVVHYYGTDTDRFAYPERSYREKKVVNILMCGRLEPKKAHEHVLQALHLWEQRKDSEYSFDVTFAGDGRLRSKLELLVQEYGWQDRVHFLGHVPYNDQRLLEEYRRADIFTLPSVVTPEGDKEGIPGTVVEAMACGLPVVSTYHAGIPGVVTNEKDGLLVEEHDVEALSQALGRLIEHRALREQLGRVAAISSASHCRLLSKTPELECIYDQLLAGKLTQAVIQNKMPSEERLVDH